MGYNVTGHMTGNISLQDCHTDCQEANSTLFGKKIPEIARFFDRER
jgi:hypothetical protein